MVGRNRTLLVLASVVAVALAGCGARGEPATVDAPSWHAGYTWSHEGSVRYAFEESFGDERENGTGDATFTSTERVVNTGFDADGAAVYLTVQRFVTEGDDVGLDDDPALRAYRQADLKPVEVDGMRTESCRGDGRCSGSLQGVALRDEHPDDAWIPFPVRTGDSWSGSYDIFGDDLEMRYTAEAGRMRTVETPVGPVEALRIEVRHRPADLDAFVREVQEEAREEGFAVQDLRIDIRRDEVYYYSPAYQTIVQSASTGRDLFSATIPDGEGGTMKVRSDSRFEHRTALTGARLVAGPEQTLEGIAGLLRPDAELGDVAGVPVPETTYRVLVDAVDAEVNAFVGDAGRFEARLEGADALPEGHVLRWSLQSGNEEHATVEGGLNASFEPSPERPGRYTVVLEAVDADGAVVASAGAGLVSHYEGSLSFACQPVTADAPLLLLGGCEPLSLPVHPGAASLTVTATPESPLSNPTARLEVYDALGRPVPVHSEGDAFVVELEDFEGLNLDESPWTARWRSTVGVLDGASMDVRVDYGTAPAVAVAPAPEDGASPRPGPAAGAPAWPSWLPGPSGLSGLSAPSAPPSLT